MLFSTKIADAYKIPSFDEGLNVIFFKSDSLNGNLAVAHLWWL